MKKRLTAEQWQQEFRQLLNETIVTFHYRKKDRTLRKATGTTCLDFVPNDFQPKGTGAPAPKGQVRYYDFTVGGWRTLRLAHVTSYYETSPDPSVANEVLGVGADPSVCPPDVKIPNPLFGQTRESAPTVHSDTACDSTGKANQ